MLFLSTICAFSPDKLEKDACAKFLEVLEEFQKKPKSGLVCPRVNTAFYSYLFNRSHFFSFFQMSDRNSPPSNLQFKYKFYSYYVDISSEEI